MATDKNFKLPPSKLFIGGQWVEPQSGKAFATTNPATETEITRIALAEEADVDRSSCA